MTHKEGAANNAMMRIFGLKQKQLSRLESLELTCEAGAPEIHRISMCAAEVAKPIAVSNPDVEFHGTSAALS